MAVLGAVAGVVAVVVLGAAVGAGAALTAGAARLDASGATGAVLSATGGLCVAWHESSSPNDHEKAA